MTDSWKSLGDAVEELGALLQSVRWGLPLADAQTRNLRHCAAWIRDTIDDTPHPIAEHLAMQSACDALVDWLIQPQDQESIDRAHTALRVYWQLCGELDVGLPQQIGSINPDTLACPSCDSTRRIKQVGEDAWEVTLIHEPGCLWFHRPRTNPQAN